MIHQTNDAKHNKSIHDTNTGGVAKQRKAASRADRTKEIRQQANSDANDATVRNMDKRRARRKFRGEFLNAVAR